MSNHTDMQDKYCGHCYDIHPIEIQHTEEVARPSANQIVFTIPPQARGPPMEGMVAERAGGSEWMLGDGQSWVDRFWVNLSLRDFETNGVLKRCPER